jgi:hypothetical protein
VRHRRVPADTPAPAVTAMGQLPDATMGDLYHDGRRRPELRAARRSVAAVGWYSSPRVSGLANPPTPSPRGQPPAGGFASGPARGARPDLAQSSGEGVRQFVVFALIALVMVDALLLGTAALAPSRVGWGAAAVGGALLLVAIALSRRARVIVPPGPPVSAVANPAVAHPTTAGPAWSNPASSPSASGSVDPSGRVPREPYEMLEKLGAGTMGEVWRARHHRLRRDAAVKVIRPGSVETEDLDRFKREARMMARLVSPYAVTVFDFGERADGSLFYAMELLDGIDLQEYVTRFGPMPPARVVRIMQHVCHCLAEAHSVGLVHRDLKPSNVMLCRYGRDVDFVKVLDFGLAKGVTEATLADTLTRDGTVLGTPAYIAPESLRGSKEVDGQVDIYALGCIAFWLLTGRMVFEETNAMAMVKAHVGAAPRRPSDVAPQPIPALLDEVVLACLAKDPAQRIRGAPEVSRRFSVIKMKSAWTEADADAWWADHMPAPSVASPPVL